MIPWVACVQVLSTVKGGSLFPFTLEAGGEKYELAATSQQDRRRFGWLSHFQGTLLIRTFSKHNVCMYWLLLSRGDGMQVGGSAHAVVCWGLSEYKPIEGV